MKTIFISLPKPSLNSIIGFLSVILLTSCSSYQNSSYYDTDGIYGTTNSKFRENTNPNESSIAYQNYFNSLQDNSDTTKIFTDIDTYMSYNDTIHRQNNSNYASWGSNSQNVTINYYPNNWGMSFGYPYYGYTWRNSYYNWGYPYSYWDYPYYGWGYPNYYGYYYYPTHWIYPTYGHSYRGTNYSYNNSRRGSYYTNNLNPSGNYIGRTSMQNSTNYPNRSNYTQMGTAPTFSRNSSSSQSQNFLYNNIGRTRTSDSNPNPARTYNPNRNNDSYSPSRSYNPSRNDSYTPSRSSESSFGRSGGGSYGGGGSYSGGGRRGGR